MNATLLGLATFIYFAAFILSLLSVRRGGTIEKIAALTAFAGFIGHSAGIVIRWIESYGLGIGHAPLSNLYEALVFFAWAVILLCFCIEYGSGRKNLAVLALPVAFVMMAYASFSPHMESGIMPLIPALKSNWLAIHVVACFLGYAAFVIAALMSALLLIKNRRRPSKETLQLPGNQTSLKNHIYRSLFGGYILFTLGIATGSVWAHRAWGSYWSWDPKETWALITWLVYSAILHGRLSGEKDGGTIMALMTLLGLLCVAFTFLGVNLLPGLHSYL